MVHKLCILICLLSAWPVTGYAQQPFELDTTFRTNFDLWYVNSILLVDNGALLISGKVRFTGDPVGSFRDLAKLDQVGQLDPTFPEWTPGGGKLTQWQDRFYMGGHNVQRILMSGLPDPSFILMNYGPYFSSFQAGDYHVYPDGRILMSGLHFLSDTVRGFTGGHCLVWFSNEGYLDTTAHHRTCSGSLDVFQELPDGRFIGSLGSPPNTATYDGQTTGSNIIRFHADGALDTTFQANAWWGGAYGFLPMEDGRVYAAGLFRIDGIEDTLHLVRFMPDGSLDPSFNNLIKFRVLEITSPYGAVPSRIYEYDDDHLIVLGGFELVAGSPRRGICMINTTGQLVEDLFEDAGCDNYNYNDFIHGSIAGMLPSSDGQWYIWGAYHGYDDGTINDPQQRFISRLYGPNVGVNEREEKSEIKIFPNPGDNEIMIDFQDVVSWPIEMKMYSQLGELVLARTLKQPQARVNTRKLASGMYSIQLEQKEKRIGSVKWVKE